MGCLIKGRDGDAAKDKKEIETDDQARLLSVNAEQEKNDQQE